MPVRGRIGRFSVGRSEAPAGEYEDACWVEPPEEPSGMIHCEQLAVAVADGASEAMLAGRWATALVRHFTAASAGTPLDAVVATAVPAWDAIVEDYLRDREGRAEPIRWFEEPGLRRGAFATLVGARLDDTGRFTGWAIGDSCMFQVRDDQIVTSFPLRDAAEFGNAPDLVPSRPIDPARITAHQHHMTGYWRPGDVFYLATDAVAQWILAAGGAEGAAWLCGAGSDGSSDPDPFVERLTRLRAHGDIRDDDATLLRIELQ